ncbi:MAG: Crp/Fnr family transcriptional regulator [Lewinellaceae bacterium]|nr:Crp/Fnr family transcriptional regulator [Saprospiraceae bacterium]MCB9316205.1 Crp/Fnr family transcriptional regulator [Lewinellaceae bacterium]MCB9329636.1 Crp/Fnr family transcriptional regulator [Lewinellaceae bacterium]
MSCQMQAIEKIVSPFQFRHLATVDQLPPGAAEHFRRGVVPTTLKKGALLFRQGHPARGIYFLVQGKVKSYQEKKGGQRRIAHVYSEGDMLGYCPLFTNGMHTYTVEALENCTLHFMPSDAFNNLIGESPFFAQFMLRAVSQEFVAWTNFQAAFDATPVRMRLALALLILHEKYRLPGNATAVIQFTRTDLADYVGASLETIVRTMREFRENGVVHVRGRRIMVSDLEALIALAMATGQVPSARALA